MQIYKLFNRFYLQEKTSKTHTAFLIIISIFKSNFRCQLNYHEKHIYHPTYTLLFFSI